MQLSHKAHQVSPQHLSLRGISDSNHSRVVRKVLWTAAGNKATIQRHVWKLRAYLPLTLKCQPIQLFSVRSMTPFATPNYLTKGRLTVKNSKWKENNPLHYGLNICSLHTHTLTTACSVSSMESYTHFWSPRAPGSLICTTDTQKPVKQLTHKS